MKAEKYCKIRNKRLSVIFYLHYCIISFPKVYFSPLSHINCFQAFEIRFADYTRIINVGTFSYRKREPTDLPLF